MLVQIWIMKGKRPYVDPRYRTRSYIEGKLVEIMERCWAHKRQDRPPIFEVVTYLRDVKETAKKMGVLERSEKVRIP